MYALAGRPRSQIIFAADNPIQRAVCDLRDLPEISVGIAEALSGIRIKLYTLKPFEAVIAVNDLAAVAVYDTLNRSVQRVGL